MKKAPRVPVLLLLSVSACGVACGDDEPQLDGGGGAGAGTSSVTTTASSGSGSGGGGGGSGLEIVWAPCPLSSDDTEGSEALCATIPVPLDWNDPNGAKIDFFVKKLPAEEQPARGQLWMLNGGPGYSGADFEGKVKAVTLDVYLPDHRGTGRSSRLGCPEQEADASPDGYWVNDDELAPCLDHMKMEWGDNVLGFTTTNAARDVGEVIEATRKADDEILVSGGSYGSIWANRYLQIYPDQSSGVVLDAFAVGLLMTRDDRYFNELGQRWMDACAADPICGARFGPDPWGEMTAALGALESGGCPEILAQGWDRDELHLFWSFFFYTWEYRSLIAPMVYRIARCEPRDVAAMQNLHDVFTQPMAPTASQRFFSMLLSTHVMLSELWEDPPPTAAELEAYQSAANVAHGIAAPAQALYDAWPRYPKDAYAGGLADTDVPILMMRGEYDFIPMSAIEPAVEHFSTTGTFVEIPGSPHSPYAAPPAMGGPACGTQILIQFFADPTATLDTSCTSEVAALPLVPSAQLSAAAFGVADPWDGTLLPSPSRIEMGRSGERARSSPGSAAREAAERPSAAVAAAAARRRPVGGRHAGSRVDGRVCGAGRGAARARLRARRGGGGRAAGAACAAAAGVVSAAGETTRRQREPEDDRGRSAGAVRAGGRRGAAVRAAGGVGPVMARARRTRDEGDLERTHSFRMRARLLRLSQLAVAHSSRKCC